MAYMTDTRSARATLSDRYTTFKTDLADRWARYRVYRETVSELSALSNRDLADLGIGRGAIHGIAMEAAYGK